MDIRNHNPISSEFLSFFPKFDREGCNGILFDFLNFLPIAYPKVHLYSGLLFFSYEFVPKPFGYSGDGKFKQFIGDLGGLQPVSNHFLLPEFF